VYIQVSDGESSHHSCSSLESSAALPFEVKAEYVNIQSGSEVEHDIPYSTVTFHIFTCVVGQGQNTSLPF